MDLPQGVTPPKLGQVCRLRKSLYGLRQASQQWYKKLSQVLVFTQLAITSRSFLFAKSSSPSSFTALLIYVDDMKLSRNNPIEIAIAKQRLDDLFKNK